MIHLILVSRRHLLQHNIPDIFQAVQHTAVVRLEKKKRKNRILISDVNKQSEL